MIIHNMGFANNKEATIEYTNKTLIKLMQVHFCYNSIHTSKQKNP